MGRGGIFCGKDINSTAVPFKQGKVHQFDPSTLPSQHQMETIVYLVSDRHGLKYMPLWGKDFRAQSGIYFWSIENMRAYTGKLRTNGLPLNIKGFQVF